MKLAFLISAQKDARHLKDLVKSLPADAEFFIHIDKKRDLHHFSKELSGDNIHFINHRVNIVSGSLNEVEVQIALIRTAMESEAADYLVYLDGMDYPLWSNARIEKVLEEANGKEFLEGISMIGQGREAYKYCDFQLLNDHHWRTESWKNRARTLASRMLAQGHVHKTLRIHCPGKTYTLFKGGTSWAITPQLAQKVLDEWDENKHLTNYFSTSYRPVETFIPTVAFNSEFAGNCILAKGKYEDMEKLSPLTFFIGRTAKTLTEDDFAAVKESDKMFCRQIVTGYSDGLKSLIDANRA